MININVGGVPEHFNLAWHQAMEDGAFKAAGINIRWQDVPGGTGAMCKQLREGELDIAIALTEGVVSDIMQGNPSRIVQFYVNSPLRWGIFVNAKSSIQTISQMQGHTYAISRYKSGSHLMAYVNARQNQLTLAEDDFMLVGDLEGAREALGKNEAQLFMWEKFTTKPLVDTGEFRMIGECHSPWPCFVIVVREAFIDKHEDELPRILHIVNTYCRELKNNTNAPQLIAQRYGIKLEDAAQWFKELEFACSPEIEEQQMSTILRELVSLNIITDIPRLNDICYPRHLIPVL